jgi:hypothetical protein
MIDYSVPGPLTGLRPDQIRLAESLPADPRAICKAVQSLVIQPRDAPAAGIPDERIPEKNLRSAAAIIDALIAQDPRPLSEPRTAGRRVVGTCRHFATLATALLRFRGVPARARCGFGAYFVKGRNLDHWVIEYRPAEDARWIRLEFLTGGEAWQWYRTGEVDGDLFGVGGPDPVWGPGEIRGNAIRDLAALNKVEMLPWDEWSRMDDSYQGRTGPDFDALMDEIAATTDPEGLYLKEDLAVPEELIN